MNHVKTIIIVPKKAFFFNFAPVLLVHYLQMAFIIMEMHWLCLCSLIWPLSVDHLQNLPPIGTFMGLCSRNNLPFSISGPKSLQMLYAGLAERTQAIYRYKLQKSLHRLISAPSRSYKSNYSIRNYYKVVFLTNHLLFRSLFIHLSILSSSTSPPANIHT